MFSNDSDFNDFEDPLLNTTTDDRNSTNKLEKTIKTNIHPSYSVLWLCTDILFVIYSLTILVFVFKKHRHHLEPVHLLTLSAFINAILSFSDFIIYEYLSIWKSPVWIGHSNYFGNAFWLSFLFNVLLEDLNGFIFVRFDVYYYEWITNYRTMVAIIIMEVLGAFIAGMTKWQAQSTIFHCYPYFTSEAFYISSVPYLFCFITSVSVVFYMIYKRYQLSIMEAPQHNITLVVPASPQQGQNKSSKVSTSRGNSQHASRQVVPMIPGQLQAGRLTPPAHEIPTVSRETDENDQTPKERLQSPRRAWLDPSVPTTSAYVQNQPPNTDEDIQEQVGWQDPALWLQSQCFPPAIPNFVEKIRQYLKANIYSLVLISFLLPPNVIIIIIKIWGLTCEDWGSFVENFTIFHMIFIFAYPYFVKLKLDNFH